MIETKVSVSPKKKAPYVKNKDLYREVIVSKQKGELTANAITMIMKMSQETIKLLKFKYEDDKKDCIQTAITKCLLYWKNFNPDKSKNAFAYFTQIIKNGYTESFNKLHPIKSANVISISDESIRFM